MGKKAKILIIDDTERDLRLFEAILITQGYETVLCPGGEEAPKKTQDEHPDVIILDVMMPGLDGFEVCRRIKKDPKTAPIPILMVTALKERTDRLAGIEAGANDFLTKPVDSQELILRVRNAVYAKSLFGKLKDNYEKLKELETSRDFLIHMIVHDLRTPLMGISANLELLQLTGKKNLDQKQKKYVAQGLNSVSIFIEMISSLLDINRFEQGKMELNLRLCDLRDTAREAIEMLGALKSNYNISFELSKGPINVSCDPDIIRRVIVNLLGNAIDNTPKGGKVELSMKVKDNQTKIAVIDNGQGIPPGYHTKIFEKFGQIEMRKENKKYSTGFGLTFCKLAVEAHSGLIGVESKVGLGSKFWFTLPVKI